MQRIHKKHMTRWLLPGLFALVLCAPAPNTGFEGQWNENVR